MCIRRIRQNQFIGIIRRHSAEWRADYVVKNRDRTSPKDGYKKKNKKKNKKGKRIRKFLYFSQNSPITYRKILGAKKLSELSCSTAECPVKKKILKASFFSRKYRQAETVLEWEAEN